MGLGSPCQSCPTVNYEAGQDHLAWKWSDKYGFSSSASYKVMRFGSLENDLENLGTSTGSFFLVASLAWSNLDE